MVQMECLGEALARLVVATQLVERGALTVPGFGQLGIEGEGGGEVLESGSEVVQLQENTAAIAVNDFVDFLVVV